MNSKKIDHIYKDIFDTFEDVTIKEHIKKLIELDYYFPFNNTFFCITNTALQKFEYVSKNFTSCTGLENSDMLADGMNYFWERFHPDDTPLWIKSLQALMEFTMNELNNEQRSKMSYTWNYRIKNAKENYVNIIQNTTPLQFDETNKPIIGLAHYTVLDIGHNMDICASAKYLNKKNEYETLFFTNLSNQYLLEAVSNRERDVIRLLLVNKSSNEIAEKLFISKHTVDTHRRNILKKFNLNSTGELHRYFKSNPHLF